jgi:hypothetical protein
MRYAPVEVDPAVQVQVVEPAASSVASGPACSTSSVPNFRTRADRRGAHARTRAPVRAIALELRAEQARNDGMLDGPKQVGLSPEPTERAGTLQIGTRIPFAG